MTRYYDEAADEQGAARAFVEARSPADAIAYAKAHVWSPWPWYAAVVGPHTITAEPVKGTTNEAGYREYAVVIKEKL